MSMLSFLLLASAVPDCPKHDALLARLASAVETRYVAEEDARNIGAQLRAWRDEGRYGASCGDDAAFLDRLNRDLDRFDGHFHVERAGASDGNDWLMAWRAGAKAANAGIREVSVLEGNIGYVRISSFYSWDIAREKYRAAWALLGDTDGLIIDLRLNGGGDGAPAAQILRSVLGPDVRSVQAIERRDGTTVEALPEAELPPLRSDLPIVVIVDRRSASASEALAYALQMEKRALVVGARSAGAANMFGDPVPLGDDYQVAIPSARPVNRVSKDNWEGRGVQPDRSGGDDPLFVARMLIAADKSPPAK
jgi:hypothetical protein